MRQQLEDALQQRAISDENRIGNTDEKNDLKAVNIWEDFKGKTTAHGVPHIDAAKGRIKRTFWTFISLVMIGGFLYNLTSITRFFIRYPVSVNIEMQHKSQLIFPAVTICNMSPVKASALFGANKRKKRSTPSDMGQDAGRELKKLATKRRKRRSADECKGKEVKFRAQCYYASNDKKSFEVAAERCEERDSTLVSIVDQAEQDFVQSISIDEDNNDYWIGLELGDEQKWMDGTAVSYTNWLKSAPDNVDGMCVRMSSGGVWLDMKCTSKYRFVCKTLAPADTTTEPHQTTETTANIMTTTTQNIGEETSTQMQRGDTTKPEALAIETTEAQENAETSSNAKETTSSTQDSVTRSRVITTSASESSTVDSKTTAITDSLTSPEIPLSTISPPDLQTLLSTTQEVKTTNPTESSESSTRKSSPKADETTDTPATESDREITQADTPLPTSVSCCCTCCISDGNFQSCGTCAALNIYNASHCAQSTLEPVEATVMPTQETTAFSPTTTERPQQPARVNGSSFPERIPVREDFKQEEIFTEILASTPLEDKKALGFRAEDMILDCKFSGHDCYMSDFTEFYNSIHGNCYIFNAGWNQTNQLFRSTKAGRRHGLHMVLNINQAEYVKQVGDTAGVRLVIHPQTRMPFPEDEGITISPGHSTSVGIRQLHVVREPDPYGNCSEGIIPNYINDVYGELYGTQYSTLKTCYQKNVVDKCGCGDPYFPMEGAAFNDRKISACNSNNIEEDDCRYLINLLFKNNSLDCNCPPQCRESSFILGTSIGVWPSEVQKESILEKLSAKTGIEMTGASYDYKLNLIKLEIHYEEFNFERITERPAYTVTSYLSDIGGILGLWIGFSLFTIFEFVELFFDWMIYLCARPCNKKKATLNEELAMTATKVNVALPNQVQIKYERSSNDLKNNPEGTPPPPYQNLHRSNPNKQGILNATNGSRAVKTNKDFSHTPIRFRRGSQNSYLVKDSPDLLNRKHLHVPVDLI